MRLLLQNLDKTRELALVLGRYMLSGGPHLLLLQGGLGAGKTTFARYFVEALPGAEQAEISSPSFTVCNIYPTEPEVWHFDLYRLDDASTSEDFLDCLDMLRSGEAEAPLALVEWPERIPEELLPEAFIRLKLGSSCPDRGEDFREADIEISGALEMPELLNAGGFPVAGNAGPDSSGQA